MNNPLRDLRNAVGLSEKNPQEIVSEATPRKLRLLHGATIVSKEAGELLDAAARYAFYDKPLTQEVADNLIEECFDVLYGIQVILNAVNSNVETAIALGCIKIAKRYPDGYSNEACAERADKQEFEEKGIDWQLGGEDGVSVHAATDQGHYLLEFLRSGEARLYIDGQISRDFHGMSKEEVLARVRETYNETRRKAWEKEARK